jgi:trigger factor
MLRTVEDISATKKRLMIEIPADVIEKEIRDSLEKVRRTTTIPGFRPGKAPIGMVEKKFGKRVEGDVIDRMVPKAYVDALSEADIMPVTNPVMENELDFKRNQPISMTFTVEIVPKVDNLSYEGIKLKDIPVSVSDSDIEDVLKRLQEERATYEPSEGPVDMNDLIVCDYTIKEDGTEVKDQIFKVGGGAFPEDFSQKMLGKKKGDEAVAETAFPADHPSEKLAGKNLTLNVIIKDIKKVNLPQLDDEFAKDMGFGNIDDLKKQLGEEILRSKRNEVDKMQKAEIVMKLIEAHEFDIPESLVESELDTLASAAASLNKEQGALPDAGQAPEEVKERLRPHAIRNVKTSLLLDIIGRREKVAVTDDEIRSAITSMSRRFAVSPEQLMKFYISRDGSLNGLKSSIFEEKVLDLILSKAVVEKGE